VADQSPVARGGRSSWRTRILLLAAALVVTFVVVRVIGKVDWVGGAAALDGGRRRDQGTDQHDGLPRDRAVGLGNRHRLGEHHRACRDQTGDGRRHLSRGEHRDQGTQPDDCPGGPRAHGTA
jgi:hypothetical protein